MEGIPSRAGQSAVTVPAEIGRRGAWKGDAASGLLGAVAALPWLQGFSYSRGYDLSLWIYNAWYLNGALSKGALPNWSHYAACGQPFFKIAGLADSAVLAGLMGLWGVFGGIQAFVLCLYVAASVGLYRFAFALLGCRFSAWVAAATYALSWFLTFTVYFQAYLSNMFVYAAIPWFVLYARRAVAEGEVRPLWAAALLLAAGVLANPQVAIKMLILGGVLALPLLRRGAWRPWLAVWACIGIAALAFSLFDLVSALRLRDEVLTINARRNSYVGPFTLIAIPAYALGLLTEFATGQRWPAMQLWELLYSEYPGMVAVVLAVVALIHVRDRMVSLLWLIVVASYALFFLILPDIPASPWLGTGHNALIFPVFALALLSGYGVNSLREKLGDKGGERRATIAAYGVASLLCIELYSLLLGLKIWGTSGTAPAQLPEVAVWTEVAEIMQGQDDEPRFFSLNPDWTIGLFPVVTGLPTANVIELRQRTPDYQAYLDLIKRCARSHDCGAPPSLLLAPLNVAFVDVPRKYYTYTTPNRTAAASSGYESGRAVFDRDGHLREFATRALQPEDLGPQAAAVDWSPVTAEAAGVSARDDLAQVIYENEYRLSAFVAPRTVAIVGAWMERQEVFARIVDLPGYDPGHILYLLVDSLDELGPAQRAALSGYIAAGGESGDASARLGLGQLQAWYAAPAEAGLPSVERWIRDGAERLVIRLERPVEKDGFLFVSQQRFRDWHGRYGTGASAPVYKATAGLSAVFLPAGTREAALEYKLPRVEVWARWFSLCAFAGATAAAWGRGNGALRKRLRKMAIKAT